MTGDRVRDEAERLVAAALTAISASLRAGQSVGPALATGSAECCICPVCRAIAAVRDPNSDLADRLAAGVGDLATGVAGLLRILSARGERAAATSTTDDHRSRERPDSAANTEWWEELRRKATDAAQAYARRRDTDASTVDDPWRVATREQSVADEPASGTPPAEARKATARKAVAQKAAQKAARKATGRKAPLPHATASPAAGTVATKAVATKAVPKKAVAKKAVAKKAVATKATVKRAAAKASAQHATTAATPDGAA